MHRERVARGLGAGDLHVGERSAQLEVGGAEAGGEPVALRLDGDVAGLAVGLHVTGAEALAREVREELQIVPVRRVEDVLGALSLYGKKE